MPLARYGMGGYLYGTTDPQNPILAQSEAEWAAGKFDLNVNSADVEAVRGTINPNQIYVPYVAHNTMFTSYVIDNAPPPVPDSSTEHDWLYDVWAPANSVDPEDLFVHATDDFTFVPHNQLGVFIPGWPNGSAQSRSESRVPSPWWNGTYPVGAYMVANWRQAFVDHFKYKYEQGEYGSNPDGVFIDSWQGAGFRLTSERPGLWVELSGAGGDDEEARKLLWDALRAMRNLFVSEMNTYFSRSTFRVFPNIGDAAALGWDNNYHSQDPPDLPMQHVDYDTIALEYLITLSWLRGSNHGGAASSSSNITDVLKLTYERLEAGVEFFSHSETTWTQSEWEAFGAGYTWLPRIQHIIAGNYLIAHANNWMGLHVGGADYYGPEGDPFTYQYSHWHPNWEVDLGAPVVRAAEDAWGQTNTNRFFIADEDYNPGYIFDITLGRQFENGIVLARFGQAGYQQYGGGPELVVDLGGSYEPLLADNSRGAAVSQVSLYNFHGAILMTPQASTTTTTTASPAAESTATWMRPIRRDVPRRRKKKDLKDLKEFYGPGENPNIRL